MTLKEKVFLLPTLPGVYIMKDEAGQVIYVGKAKNLKSRVSSYFNASQKNEKTEALVSKIKSFDYIVAQSEVDALALECNLIHKHLPFYNILLKDGKGYPYFKMNLKKAFPKLEVVRRLENDGAKYFGPYFAGVRTSHLGEILRACFTLRECNLNLANGKTYKRPCLNYALGHCSGPCIGKVTQEEYKNMLEQVMAFLKGDTDKVAAILTQKMETAAEMEAFEQAVVYRNLLLSLDRINQKAISLLPKNVNADIIGFASNDRYGVISFMVVRHGKLLGIENFNVLNPVTPENMESFIMQYYQQNSLSAQKIILPFKLENEEALLALLHEKTGESAKVLQFIHPQKGDMLALLKQANLNASEFLEKSIEAIAKKEQATLGAMETLKQRLNLVHMPHRIECYDISNISGTNKVASMVVFINGEAAKKHYRKFKIQTVQGANDFASLAEVLSRRIKDLTEKANDASFGQKPDLIVIDGGKGQLSTTAPLVEGLKIDIISLAEKNEEVYQVGQSSPVIFSRDSYALKLLQNIRDEAHRFAISYYRNLHTKEMIKSKQNKKRIK